MEEDIGTLLAGRGVSALFGELLVPLPHENDVHDRAFVVNRQAGRRLCCLLEGTRFFALAGDVQLQMVSLLDAGLNAGHCSAVRLRLSCEDGQLIECLVELLKGLIARVGGDGASFTPAEDNGLIEVVGRVLGKVCSAGIRVDELKRLLQELRMPSALTPPLLGALSVMARSDGSNTRRQSSGICEEPMESMFDFGGDGAGLVLPVAHWPFPQEYQLVAWVRVEQSATSTAGGAKLKTAATRAHLITFTTEMGAGVDYYIQDSRLFVAVADGGGDGPIQPTVVDIGAAGLISGRWHALVISHRRSSTLLFNKDQLEVYVDKQLCFSASVPYPRRISGPLARSSIGWNLDGQTSGVLLLSGVASLKIANSMLNRLAGRPDDVADGTDAFGCSSPDLDLWDDTATVSAQQRLKRKLLGSKYRFFAALLPNRAVDDLCLEPHNGHHGLLRRGTTRTWITHTVQDVIKSIGGASSLLSLAKRLLSETPDLSLGSKKNTSFNGRSVDTVLSVVLSFLDGNVANQGDFFFAGGIEILELLLRSAPKVCFSSAGAHTVMVLERILEACRSHRLSAYIQQALPGLGEDAYRPQAGISSPEHQILVCLLANFPLWARAPPEFQFGLVTSVLDVVRDGSELCRQSLPLELVLASVRVCCPDQMPGEAGQSPNGEETVVAGFMSSETTSESSADLSETSSTEQDWTSMARRERLHMRGFLWELVRLLLDREVNKQDGDALAHFLASCDDTRLVCELVQVLSSLMRKSAPPAGLFWALENASCVHEGVEKRRRGSKTGRPRVPHSGFLSLVLERCVLVDGASEDLRVAGLRAANVFMARSAKANERDGVAAGGESMDSKVFPLLSEGLVRDRHILGEATYAALLEMALLGDERNLPWAEQDHVVGFVESNTRIKRRNNNDLESEEGPLSEYIRTEDEDLASGVWWDCDSQDGGARGGTGHVLDDAQLIRNLLPLALILQFLPTMANSVQVRSHGDLLLMLKLNEANRQKVMELSHVHNGKFSGIWERCMFLMMAPLFSRGVLGLEAELDRQDGTPHDGERKGDYFMVLRLYALLLEHAMSFDGDGYKEIAVATSLQHLIPNGRIAGRVLLAQLAFEVGQNPEASLQPESRSDSSSDTTGPEGEQEVERPRQPRWDNMIHLAFIAANIVSDDVSTVTLGLFPEGEGVGRGRGLPGDELGSSGAREAIRASAASASIPLLLCSNPAGHASLALAARVLGMFGVLSGGASSALIELCSARSPVSGQGPLMFPLLRLSVFLLVRLHPFTKPAQENLGKLASLVECLLGDDWCLKEKVHAEDSNNMCIVVLAHVHAALLRLKALAMTVGGTSYGLISEARKALAGDDFASTSVHSLAMDATAACEFGRTLVGLLRYIALCRQVLLRTTLGERLVVALQKAIKFAPQDAFGISDSMGASGVPEQHADRARRCWDHLLQSLKWMEGSFLFSGAEETAMRANNGVAALLEACMPSLKAAEEIESQAVREAGERTRQWRELANRTAPGGDAVAFADGSANKVLETIRQQALNAEASRRIKTGCRLLASRRRLQCYLDTLGAAWSPWAAGQGAHGGNEPRGWEVSSHKDQLMRQMLLVPVDADVGHADEAYAGTNPRSGDGDSHQDPAMVSGVQPSKSLLAGVDFHDDDDEITDGEAENDQSSFAAESFGHAGASSEPAEWEHIPPPGAVQVESVVSVQLAANQQEQESAVPTSTGGFSQRVFGKWRVTNVLKQGSVPGKLYLFEESLVFESERNEIEGSEEATAPELQQQAGLTWRWRLGRLTQLHLRRFLLSPQAVELFWADSPEVFLAFQDVTARQAFTRHLRKRNLPMLPVITRQGILHPRKVLKACRLTESWRRRQISNFQYIMALNVIAGRSFNDISQYPVFPWVLADYTSSELDLNNPASFRDLSRPMGALSEQRRRLFLERYASFEDEMVPKFMYGTHYSSAGVVLHYLVRQDPFTTLHVNLQGGRFDCPDRLFHDMGQSWKGCADGNSMSDVKELTPEFFYSPEIFLNSNRLPLGEMQGGRGAVDDVRLPPWAKDAFDFVRIHRLALESEQVSKQLHRWIDLIFGYQQRGDEAVNAVNVFYYLTYEGAVDLSLVKDARQREAMEAQIHHFGQTPSQVLNEPHPIRLPPEECVLPIFSPTSTVDCLRVFSAGNRPPDPCRAEALLVYCTLDRLVSVDAALRITSWTWSGVPDGFGLPFTLGSCRTNFLPSRSLHMSSVSARTSAPSGQVPIMRALPSDQEPFCQATPLTEVAEEADEIKGSSPASCTRRLASTASVASVPPSWKEGTPAVRAPKISRVHSCFGLCTASPGSCETILSCGYWDNMVRVHRVNSAVKLPLEGLGTGGHLGAISCLAVAEGSSLLVTGGQDATCRVWVVGNPAMASALGGTSACGVNATKGTSSRDSMVCVHVLYGHDAPVTCLAVSEELDAVVSGASDGRIVLHCLKDGSYVRQYRCGLSVAHDAGAPIPASQLVFSCHGDVVAHSWADCSLHRFSINGTRLATTVAPTAMNCLLTAGGGDYLLAGGQDGLISVFTLHDLRVLHTIDLQQHGGVTCMRLSPNDEYLLVGSQDGEVSIITDARKRMRMLDLAMRKAFVG